MKSISAVLFLLLASITEPSFAWEKIWDAPKVENSCLTYDARYSEAPLFQIATDNKVHFYSKKISNSESLTEEKKARKKTYLIKGDVVFAGPEDKKFRCVYYGTQSGSIIAGFIRANQLKPYPENDNLSQEFLVGTWTSWGADAKIVITTSGTNKVKGIGNARYVNADGAENQGAFEAVANFHGKEMAFHDDDCTVKLLRRGPYLVAVDNNKCGGYNVSFSGILVKIKPKAN